MEKIEIDGEQYYTFNNIITKYNVSYKKSSNNFLNKYKIPKNKYIHATKCNNKYKKILERELETKKNTMLMLNAKYFDTVFKKSYKPKTLIPDINETTDSSVDTSNETSEGDNEDTSGDKEETSEDSSEETSEETSEENSEETSDANTDVNEDNKPSKEKKVTKKEEDSTSEYEEKSDKNSEITDNEDSGSNEDNDSETTEEEDTEKKIRPIPDIIKLLDKEKIKDDKGNIIEIKIVGSRDYNKCYFNMTDISKGLGITKLYATIIHKLSSYRINEHYTYFMTKENKKQMYLTYIGFLKVLFTTRNTAIKKFVSWCTEVIFASHMGTEDQKKEQSSKLLDISVETLKKILNMAPEPISCIYLIKICKIIDYKGELDLNKKYSKSAILYKWGCTEDFSLRLSQHKSNFGKITVIKYVQVDKKNKFKAEKDIKKFFVDNNMKITTPDREEYATINSGQIKMVKKEYNNIAKKYRIDMDYIIDTKNANEIEYNRKLAEKELENKDLQISLVKKENELLKKENELMKAKHELEILKIKKK